MIYKVEITEVLKMTDFIEADSRTDAELIAQEQWENGDYIIDGEHLDHTEFRAVEQ